MKFVGAGERLEGIEIEIMVNFIFTEGVGGLYNLHLLPCSGTKGIQLSNRIPNGPT